MDQVALLKLRLESGEKRSAAMRAALHGDKISAKGRQILAKALGHPNAANLYRRKILAVMIRQVANPNDRF